MPTASGKPQPDLAAGHIRLWAASLGCLPAKSSRILPVPPRTRRPFSAALLLLRHCPIDLLIRHHCAGEDEANWLSQVGLASGCAGRVPFPRRFAAVAVRVWVGEDAVDHTVLCLGWRTLLTTALLTKLGFYVYKLEQKSMSLINFIFIDINMTYFQFF